MYGCKRRSLSSLVSGCIDRLIGIWGVLWRQLECIVAPLCARWGRCDEIATSCVVTDNQVLGWGAEDYLDYLKTHYKAELCPVRRA